MRLPWRDLTLVSGLAFAVLPIVTSLSNPEPALVARANSTNAATYVVQGDGNLRFTLTVGDDGDMWFQMSCSDKYPWMAVGTGEEMDGSLMFVGYRDGTKNGVTLSGRFGSGHVEPVYSKSIKLNKVVGNDTSGSMTVAGFCSNCTTLAKNSIDLTNKNQNFIWAVGPPGHNPWTQALDGPLRRHEYYGYFQMDMTQAKGDGMPQLGTVTVHANDIPSKGTVSDRDFGDAGHAFTMLLAFLIVFPLGVASLRVMNSVKLHLWFQSAGLLLVMLGLFSGIYISIMYNRSKHFNSAHQLVGIILVLLLIAQWTGGFLHHRYYVRNQRPWLNGRAIKGHKMILGPLILGAGLANAAIGFNFAVGRGWNLIYLPLVFLMLIALFASAFIKNFLQRRRAKRNPNLAAFEPNSAPSAPYGQGPYTQDPGYGRSAGGLAPTGGYGQMPYSSSGAYGGYDSTRSDIALSNLGDPPAYSQPAAQPKTVL